MKIGEYERKFIKFNIGNAIEGLKDLEFFLDESESNVKNTMALTRQTNRLTQVCMDNIQTSLKGIKDDNS